MIIYIVTLHWRASQRVIYCLLPYNLNTLHDIFILHHLNATCALELILNKNVVCVTIYIYLHVHHAVMHLSKWGPNTPWDSDRGLTDHTWDSDNTSDITCWKWEGILTGYSRMRILTGSFLWESPRFAPPWGFTLTGAQHLASYRLFTWQAQQSTRKWVF